MWFLCRRKVYKKYKCGKYKEVDGSVFGERFGVEEMKSNVELVLSFFGGVIFLIFIEIKSILKLFLEK